EKTNFNLENSLLFLPYYYSNKKGGIASTFFAPNLP
ncbi:MAG: hypothetical protein ACI96G_001336, partial [Flavobacterium sp.]